MATKRTKSSAHARVDSTSPLASAPKELKDTTESIVIAFILAFVFRAFVVEAFVIPTGSMAATLYGQHGSLICNDCGWENAYGLSDPAQRSNLHGAGAKVRCQNCGHVNTNLKIHDGMVNRASGRSVVPSNAESGDRILVFKWPFDLTGNLLGPNRWDVTVFKNPANGDENFIKRLVGMPREVLEIIDGDVYTVPVDELSKATVDALEENREAKYRQRTGNRLSRVEAREVAGASAPVLDELAAKLRIPPRTETAQQSHWIIVYDHDYPPRKWDQGQPRWVPRAAPDRTWSADHRKLTFDGVEASRATVEFEGPIVDHNAYNIDIRPRYWKPVSDMKIEAVLLPKGGEGYVEFTLFKRGDAFIARLNADGRVTLHRQSGPLGQPGLLGDVVIPPMQPDQPMEISFENIDYHVALKVGGKTILATTPAQYAPDISALRGTPPGPTIPPRISAEKISIELRHVSLFRDEFYTAPMISSLVAFQSKHAGWGTEGNPILLRDDEYFMLGDNSPASKDSRLWDVVGPHLLGRGENYQLGTVPKDQLIGRAFFVYWPSGLRPDWLPGRGEHFVEYFVPNVGRMRWIR